MVIDFLNVRDCTAGIVYTYELRTKYTSRNPLSMSVYSKYPYGDPGTRYRHRYCNI